MTNTFILAGNGSYANRGCEAITRGTVEILNHFFDSPNYIANSFFIDDEAFHLQAKNEMDTSILHTKAIKPGKRFDKAWFWRQRLKFFSPNSLNTYHYKEILPYIKDAKAVLSVGGDNYSLDYSVPERFTNLDDLVLDLKKPIIIWGASIGPFSKNPKYEKYMCQHLNKVTAMFVRESYTVKYLKSIGVTNNVYFVADPAFLMKPISAKEKLGFEISENAIGINFSPLMAKFVNDGNLEEWLELAVNILDSILEKFNNIVYLIPHVTIDNNNDYEFMSKVLSKVKSQDTNRVILVPSHLNAAETKWVISKMAVFAGARTHATIASFSSFVPTLSFAYSIKAKGINDDIYGHLDYCIDPTELNSEQVVQKLYILLNQKDIIKQQLKEKIPSIIDLALSAGGILKQIVENED